MRRFCDGEYCDENMYTEMAKVAAVSCIHNCIQSACGGDEKTGCRFDFPKKNLNHTLCKDLDDKLLMFLCCTSK